MTTPMQCLQFKAELRDPEIARAVCRTIGARLQATIDQVDTYYRIPQGRYKRRESTIEGRAQPIEYFLFDQTDRSLPRLSHYTAYTQRQAAERFGATPPPVAVIVSKRREVYRLESVAIHLDEVEGLGRFIEFESVETPEHSLADGRRIIAELRKAFDSSMGEPLLASYLDLALAGVEPHGEEPPPPPHAPQCE